MVIFDNNELEIAIVTYNRPKFVKKWIENCYKDISCRNITLSIYDSSTNQDTLRVIEEFNLNYKTSIQYIHINSDISIGYKPILPIMESTSKYLWISGDSRYHNFDELDKKVFPFIKKEIDYIILHILNNEENDGKIYTNISNFIHDCFISTTCIGLSIYRTKLFEDIKADNTLFEHYTNLFQNNYGFAWLGFFYNEFAKNSNTAVFCKVEINNILNDKKVQSWSKRFYECWIEDLCQIVDNIPAVYYGKEMLPIETWNIMKLYSHDYLYQARKYGDLNKNSFYYYKTNGLLARVTKHVKRIKFYAEAPLLFIEIVYGCKKILRKIQNLIRRALMRRKNSNL